MSKIIAVTNQKGGVGKTTTAVNLSACVAKKGKRVLLCDFDPQGNATSGVGVDHTAPGVSVYDVIVRGVAPERAIHKTPFCDVIPSHINLAAAEIEIVGLENREYLLRDALCKIRGDYDFIFIDCPPSLGLLTLNAFAAADTMIIPLQCEYYALEGLSQLMMTVRAVKRAINPQLEIEGVLMTMYDGRTNLTLQVADEIKKHFGSQVYPVVIPRNVRLSEAPSHGKPIIAYDRLSRGAEAYTELADLFLRKNGG